MIAPGLMQVLPALDLLDAKAVRLRKGNYDEVKVYHDDPVALASDWSGRVEQLHVVDLEGARAGHAVQRDLVRQVVKAFGAGVQIGGGVRTLEAVHSYFELGVDRVVIGTAAVRDPELVQLAAKRYPDRVVVALDARGGKVATDGWLHTSELMAVEVARTLEGLPLAALLYTDIERDGTETGPNVAATAELANQGGFPVIASGGVGSLDHIKALAGAAPGIVGAIVGRALHEQRFSLEQAQEAARGG